jgi:hypothetical protein
MAAEGRTRACDELAVLHRRIDRMVVEFSKLLVGARRDSIDLQRFWNYWASMERMLFAPQGDRASHRILMRRGRELISAVEEALGLEDEYIFRVADRVLSDARAADVAAQIATALRASTAAGVLKLAGGASA